MYVGAVTITEFASENGTAISPTLQLSFVAACPRQVRLKSLPLFPRLHK